MPQEQPTEEQRPEPQQPPQQRDPQRVRQGWRPQELQPLPTAAPALRHRTATQQQARQRVRRPTGKPQRRVPPELPEQVQPQVQPQERPERRVPQPERRASCLRQSAHRRSSPKHDTARG